MNNAGLVFIFLISFVALFAGVAVALFMFSPGFAPVLMLTMCAALGFIVCAEAKK